MTAVYIHVYLWKLNALCLSHHLMHPCFCSGCSLCLKCPPHISLSSLLNLSSWVICSQQAFLKPALSGWIKYSPVLLVIHASVCQLPSHHPEYPWRTSFTNSVYLRPSLESDNDGLHYAFIAFLHCETEKGRAGFYLFLNILE